MVPISTASMASMTTNGITGNGLSSDWAVDTINSLRIYSFPTLFRIFGLLLGRSASGSREANDSSKVMSRTVDFIRPHQIPNQDDGQKGERVQSG